MPITGYHQLTATTPDNTAYEIRPSHFNQSHLLTLNAVGTEISAAFSNLNGFSFGTNAGGAVTGSYTVPSVTQFLTTARASNDAVGLNTAATNVIWTVNSAGISLNAGGYGGTGFTSATTAGTAVVGTLNTAGLSLGVPAYLTTARASTDAVGLNTAATNVTWTVNSGGISLNAGGYAGTGFTSATTAGTAVVATNNTAGLSMGVPAYLTTARASTDAVGLNTAATNVTWTVNSAGLSLNAAGYAGTGTTFTGANISGSMTLNSNGLNLSLSGSSAPMMGRWFAPDGNDLTVLGAPVNASASVNMMPIPENLTGTRMEFFIFQSLSSSAVANTYGQQWSIYMGIYSNDTANARLVSLSSGSTQTTYTVASNTAGQTQLNGSAIRPISCPVNYSMTPGIYFVAINHVTNTFSSDTATTALNRTVSVVGNAHVSANFGMVGDYSVAVAATNNSNIPAGVFSAASTGLPGSISYSQMTMTGLSRSQANFVINFRNV